MSAPEPTAAGTLSATPMQHLLVYALDRQLGGTIVLETPDGQRSALLLIDGVPAKAKTHEPVIHLGRLLVEMGAITDDILNRTLVRVAQQRALHGRVLLDEGRVDAKMLVNALREQLARKLVWMAGLPAATMYGYYEGQDFLTRWGGEPTPIEALAAIWRVIKSYETADRVDAMLARLPRGELKLHPEAQPGRFRFVERDAVVLDILRARPQTLNELIESGAADASSVKRVVYALAVTRHLDLGGIAKPIGIAHPPVTRDTTDSMRAPVRSRRTGPRPSGQHAATDSPELAARRREIVERAKLIPQETYYQILGVPLTAPTADIQAAFFQLAKKWHPDRVPAELADVRDLVMRTFSRMSEAHHVLSDEIRRRQYDELIAQGGTAEEQEEVQAVMRAITSFRKAEVLLKKRNLAEAEALAKRAREDDPSQADYHALYAWIVSQSPERAEGPFDDLIQILNEAIKLDEDNERARFYRAQLLRRAGKPEHAMRDFRAILENNPRHVDALRELRLHEMRKSQAPPSRAGKTDPKAASGGILNKFFKR